MPIEPILTSLVGPLRKRLRRSVDILLFNPPYVPTDTEEADAAQQHGDIAGAWAGGLHGMGLTNILLDQVEVDRQNFHPDDSSCSFQELLSPHGRFYLVAVKQNDVHGICRRMLEQYGLHGTVYITYNHLLDLRLITV